MPTYEFHCFGCSTDYEIYLPIDRYKEPQTCSKCTTGGREVFLARRVSVPSFAYVADSGIKKQEEYNKAHNMYIREPGIDKDAAENRRRNEMKRREEIRKVVVDTVRDSAI